MIRFVFAFGWAKEGAPHPESFASSIAPSFTSISTSFLNMASRTLGTG